MILRVQKMQQGFIVAVPESVAKAWRLEDNSPVELFELGTAAPLEPRHRYAMAEEVRETFNEVADEYDEAFRELAKGPSDRPGPHDPPPHR